MEPRHAEGFIEVYASLIAEILQQPAAKYAFANSADYL
jgi:hypothetical protein